MAVYVYMYSTVMMMCVVCYNYARISVIHYMILYYTTAYICI